MRSRDFIIIALFILGLFQVIPGIGCTTAQIKPKDGPSQITLAITPQEANILIDERLRDLDFMIIDLRTREEFHEGHISPTAINLDMLSENFRSEIAKLNKDKTYLVYSQNGVLSTKALDTMGRLFFREVYAMAGGINAWMAEGLPIGGLVTSPEASNQAVMDITPKEAFIVIQENQDNPDFLIIALQTREDFAREHIENAINIDIHRVSLIDELDKLDRDKTYLIYQRRTVGECKKTITLQAMLEQLGFKKAYRLSGGIDGWITQGFPVVG
jgi:rhodanese-related sulfurtransferase